MTLFSIYDGICFKYHADDRCKNRHTRGKIPESESVPGRVEPGKQSARLSGMANGMECLANIGSDEIFADEIVQLSAAISAFFLPNCGFFSSQDPPIFLTFCGS